MLDRYLDIIREQIDELQRTQSVAIRTTAEWMAEAIAAGRVIHTFGASHAFILAYEMFYRAGGLACVSPIVPTGLTPDVRPFTTTSDLERLPGYAGVFMKGIDITPGDVLIVHSVSGRNAVAVEVAQIARQRGAKVVAITNMKYSQSVAARAGSLRLFEVADLVIDNCGVPGDASVEVEGMAGKCAPTSSVIGCAIINGLVAETSALLVAMGEEPPVFRSANLDGGDEYNAELLARYKGRVSYL